MYSLNSVSRVMKCLVQRSVYCVVSLCVVGGVQAQAQAQAQVQAQAAAQVQAQAQAQAQVSYKTIDSTDSPASSSQPLLSPRSPDSIQTQSTSPAHGKTNYRLHLQLLAGRGQSNVQRGISVDKAEYTRDIFNGTVRLMLQPDHLLAMGVETGLLPLSRLIIRRDSLLHAGSSMALYAIPVLYMFSMEKYGAEISSGVGAFAYHSRINNSSVLTTSTEWEIGWNIGLAYRIEVLRDFMLGAEARYYAIPERSVALTSYGLRFQYQWWY